MINRTTLHCLRLGVLALGLSASLAHAGKIAIKPTSGDAVVAVLNGESTMFADAYRAMLVKQGLATSGNSSAWRKIQFATHSPTVARVEYVYTQAGREYTRVYHARSGPAMEVVLDRVDFGASGGSSKSGSSGTESEASRGYEITEEDIAKDFRERVYYPADTKSSVRVPNLSSKDSVIQARVVDSASHEADAELKIFRQIEKDIATHTVTPGGKLVGYVSKAVCPSCRPASLDLAEHFDIEGTIYQLVEPEVGAPPARDPLVRESNQASSELKALRKAYATDHFKRNAVTSPEETAWMGAETVERIEAEETRTTLAEACVD
jgi:hypothetical protein